TEASAECPRCRRAARPVAPARSTTRTPSRGLNGPRIRERREARGIRSAGRHAGLASGAARSRGGRSRRHGGEPGAARAAGPERLAQLALAEADRVGCDLDQLVLVDPRQALLEP